MSECTVYRMYDADGALLYVGMSTNLPRRLAAHRSDKEWWPRVSRVDVKHFEGRKAGAQEERLAIAAENPEFNLAPGHCVSWDTLAERRADRVRRHAEWESNQFWDPEGSIVCTNCGRRPERFPKRQTVEDTPCSQCGVKAFALKDAA